MSKQCAVCFLAHPVYDHREVQQILMLLNIPKYILAYDKLFRETVFMHKMLRNFTLLYLQYFRLFISVTTFTTMYAVTTYVAGNITGQNLHIKIYKIIRKRDKVWSKNYIMQDFPIFSCNLKLPKNLTNLAKHVTRRSQG